jgi:tripartite-type tricarboxylate transporter receptor subunit TctC
VVSETINKAVNELNLEPEVIERQVKIGWVPFNATPAELRKQMDAEIESYKAWVKRVDFKID